MKREGGGETRPSPIIAVYSDGATISKNPSQIGGVWAYCLVNGEGEKVAGKSGVLRPVDLECPEVTSNVMELYAALKAILSLTREFNGTLYTDSQITRGRLAENWSLNGVPPSVRHLLRVAKTHLLTLQGMRYELLKGHPTKAELLAGVTRSGAPVSVFNCACDEQCRKLGEAYRLTLCENRETEGIEARDIGETEAGAGREDRPSQRAASGALSTGITAGI